jgi:hypothetical protein
MKFYNSQSIPQSMREKYSDPNLIKETLTRLKTKDWSGYTTLKFGTEVNDAIGGLSIFPVTILKGTTIYRVRSYDCVMYDCLDGVENTRLFKHLHEIGPKPEDEVKSMGRAHIPLTSVFYGSTDPFAAVLEVTQWQLNSAEQMAIRDKIDSHLNRIQTVVISTWVTTEDIHMASLILNQESIGEQTFFKVHLDFVKNKLLLDCPKLTESRNLIIDFFAKEFINKSNDYKFSTFYSQMVYRHFKEELGILYSSVASDFQALNYALPKKLHNKLKFVLGEYCVAGKTEQTPSRPENTALPLSKRIFLSGPAYICTADEDGKLIWKTAM